MKNIIVTGGSGKAGRAVCRDLVARGYEVLNLDVLASSDPVCPMLKVDLTDFAQVMDAMQWSGGRDHPFRKFRTPDAVVHLAAIPAPDLMPEEVTFRTNIVSTWNVFDAALRAGVRRIVWASSETTLGLPFGPGNPPAYAPVDEDHPMRPESGYSLSKDLGEEMARQMARWNPGTTFVGLRLSNVMEPRDYARFSGWQDTPHFREWNLWAYIDARDAADAVEKALHYQPRGFETFLIAADDTTQPLPTAELLRARFPHVPVRGELGEYQGLLNNAAARDKLGWSPHHSWRHHASA